MDLLRIFKGSPERQIARARKKVKEPYGDASIRINAARKLYEMGSEDSLLALLDRFTINVSPSNQDEAEKNEVLEWITGFGEKAVDPLTRFLKRERQAYWPVRALRNILDEESFAKKISEILTFHWENPPASADPIAQLIRAVRGTQQEELDRSVRMFLDHEDDDVVLATLAHLFENSEDAARDAVLLTYMKCEDRPRIRAKILESLSEHGWTVKGFRSKIEESLPEGYVLTREGKLRAIASES